MEDQRQKIEAFSLLLSTILTHLLLVFLIQVIWNYVVAVQVNVPRISYQLTLGVYSIIKMLQNTNTQQPK